ncbi:hypothetical protein [Luteococcus peritonei]|uniref:Uncharacterized protein n=1 Tax=Luteococcus peritonei TaxID=88874 RepID=A0ABW4RWE4_9ACTN
MRCAKCRRSILGKSYASPIGERVCRSCHDKLTGFILGGAVGGAGGAAAGPKLMKSLRNPLGWGK